MPIKLTATHYKLIAIALLVAAASFAISQRYFRRTFPEASLDLRVNRADSESIARNFLKGLGLQVDGYRHTVVFTYSDYAKLFIERKFGLERLNQLTAGPVHLWRWSNRWFRPQQQEEFSVEVAPAGDVVGFSHVIPETQAGKNLDAAAARAIAESFLLRTTKRNLSDLELLDSQDIKRPARTDHSFTWKQKSVDLGDGNLRINVDIDGDQVAGYSEFIFVPEQWSRDYEKLRSRNGSAQTVDGAFFYLLSVGMIVMLIVRLRDRDVPMRTARGFAFAGALLYFLSELNNFSLAESGYRTTESYSSFVARYFTGAAFAALGVAVVIFFLVAAAEPEYRATFPGLLSLRQYFTWKGLRTRSFFLANVVGLAMAFFFFAYQTVFYFCANKLGAWAPSDIPFTNDLNTRIPWIAVLFTGFFPAVSEEMQFRAFAIPFLRRFVRFMPIAIVLAAFNWGFLHSAYPNEPFYIRGVEVGLGGILIGFVMLRFGIVATLIWHYSVDALYSAFVLLRSPNHYLMASGALTAGIMLVPLVASLLAYLKTGTFEDETALTNAAEGISRSTRPAEAEPPPTEHPYEALSRQRLLLACVLIPIAAVIAVIPVYRFGQGLTVKMTAAEASRQADAYLRTQKLDPASYHRVVQSLNDVSVLTVLYFVEHLSVKQADHIYRTATQMLGWEVRYFRPLEIEEHRVFFDATDAAFIDHRILLDENAPGASLDSADARALAEKALVEHGYRISDFDLQTSEGEKRKAREDYHFVWEAKPGDKRNVGEARYRVAVEIAGDRVISVSDWFKLPEEWERQQQKTRLINSVLGAAGILLGVLIFTRAVILFVVQVKQGKIPWRTPIPVATLALLAIVLSEVNALPTIEAGYRTSVPLATFWLQTGIGLAFAPIFSGMGIWLLVALVASVFPQAQTVLRWRAGRAQRRDAGIAVLVSLALMLAINRFETILTSLWPTHFPPDVSLVPASLSTWSPGLAALFSAIPGSIGAAAGAGLFIAIFREGWSRRAWWFWLGCVLLLISVGPTDAHSVRQFLAVWTYGLFSLLVIVWLVTMFLRDNALAYLACVFCLLIFKPAVELLSQGARLYQWNGVLLATIGAAVLVLLLLPWRSIKLQS